MMSKLTSGFPGSKRLQASRRGPVDPRKGRRFAPSAEFLEVRITMAGNIIMTAVSTVDSNDNPFNTIYEGDEVYIRADFTTQGLPGNASYRFRYIADNILSDALYSPYISYGAAFGKGSYYYYFGPFVAHGGPETILTTVNPDRSVAESNYNDNSLTATFNAIAAPSQLVFTSQNDQPPASVTAGPGGEFGLTVAIEDQYGNVVLDDNTDQVSVNLASGPDGGILGGGNQTVTAVGGFASFSGLTLNKAGTNTLSLSSFGLMGVSARAITVIPAAASQLVITQQPNSSSGAGVNLSPIKVSIEDPYGNVETSDNKTAVSVSLASGAGPLQGQATATALNGVATFSSLSNDTAGPITVALNSGFLTQAISNTVTIIPTFATTLVILKQPSTTATVGQPFANNAPMVEEKDRFGNVVTNDNTTVVTAAPASGAGPFQGATAVLSGGVATFTSLADKRAETTSLRFTSGSLGSAISSPVVVGKATPTLSWSPAPLASGTGLGPAQFDAIAMNYGTVVPGVFTYTPGSGTVLALGSQPLSATFTPNDSSDYTTTTGTAMVNVLIASTTSLTASASTVTYKNPITFTAAVSVPSGGATPVGSVMFLDGSSVLGSSKLDGTGHATFSATSLPGGKPSITAVYSGDANYASSTSAATSLHVRDSSVGDFDGDGRSDIAVYDQTTATFLILDSGGGSRVQQFGNSADKNVPVIGDFDGDGKTDLAIYDQTLADFFILDSGSGSLALQFGNPSHVNIPIAGDFDGDGKTDLAIYDQTASEFLVLESGGGAIVQPFGNATHVNIPVAGDFDGDGKTDLAIYDQTAATFLVLKSGGGSIVQQLGSTSHVNIPIAGDFDGDGKTDLAVYDQSLGYLFALETGGGTIALPFGNPGVVNVPIAGDFDGDGKTDIAIYDQTDAQFLIVDSAGGSLAQPFGSNKHKNMPT